MQGKKKKKTSMYSVDLSMIAQAEISQLAPCNVMQIRFVSTVHSDRKDNSSFKCTVLYNLLFLLQNVTERGMVYIHAKSTWYIMYPLKEKPPEERL